MTSYAPLLVLAAAIDRQAVLLASVLEALHEAKAIKRPRTQRMCEKTIEGRPCPRPHQSLGRCWVHRQREEALTERGVTPDSPEWIVAMNKPIATTRRPKAPTT